MIGYVTAEIDNNRFAECLMKFAYQYDVPCSVISLDNLKNHFTGSPLIARRWNGSSVEEIDIPLPPCLDTGGNVFSPKYEYLYPPGFLPWINGTCKILIQKSISKSSLPSVLLASNLAQYAIPTWTVSTYSDIQKQLSMSKNLLIKPVKGRKGRGVCKIHVDSHQIPYISDADGMQILSEEVFLSIQEKNWSANLGTAYLMQPCLDFSLDDNHAVDFRLLRHRGRTGEWEEVATHAKIGGTQLVSNVAQGGYIDDVKNVLQTIAGSQVTALYDEIMYIGEELPRLIQKHQGDAAYCLGMDVAVDRKSLRPFILEANTYPGLQFHYLQAADKRVQFYQYLQTKYKLF